MGRGWLVCLLLFCLSTFPARASSLALFSYQSEVGSQQLAEDVQRKLDQIAGLFQALQAMLAQSRTDAEQHRMVKRLLEAVPHVRAVLLVDQDGRVRLDSATFPASRLLVADREYYQQARSGLPLSLWVGPLVVGRSSSLPFIPVSSLLSDGDGGMVAVAVITPDELIEPRFRCPMCSAAIVRTDGRLVFGVPYGYQPSGEVVSAMSSNVSVAPLVTRVGSMDAVSYWRKFALENIAIVYSILLHD